MLAIATFALSYQISAPPAHRPHAERASRPLMEYRLNNYILPGPLEALGDQVLVKLRKLDDKTTGGLFVPTAETEKPKEGVVVAAGPGKIHPDTGKLVPSPVQPGDVVLMAEFVGEKVEYCGEKHMFVSCDVLLGAFDGGDVSVAAFRPFADRLLVSTAEAATETTTGIALAGLEEDENNQGEVIKVGPGRTSSMGEVCAPRIAAGENVMYKAYTGADAELDGKRFKVVFETDCVAKW